MKKLQIISLLLNITLLVIVLYLFTINQKLQEKLKDKVEPKYSDELFRQSEKLVNLFVLQNDSIYHEFWRSEYVDNPENAFLVSAAYHFVTKKKNIIKDIEKSKNQLENIYHKNITISK